MKKMIIMLAMLTMTLAASAQFEKSNTYVAGTLTGLNMGYNGKTGFNFGIGAQVGSFVKNNWLLYGELGYDHKGGDCKTNDFNIGAGGRYYFQNCGVFLGAHADYVHGERSYNDFMPGIEVGYCFFVSHEVAIEPAIYYNQSCTNHSDYSTVGLKIGVSLFHKKKQLTGAVEDAFK